MLYSWSSIFIVDDQLDLKEWGVAQNAGNFEVGVAVESYEVA